MARSDTVTLLSLDRYAKIMGLYAPHFNQLNGNKAPVGSETGCSGKNVVWDQNDRDDLALNMAQAEEMIAEFLSFWPAPKFIENEQIAFGMIGNPGTRIDWNNAEVTTEFSYVECFGTETLTASILDADVTYSVSDNNPFNRENLATIGLAGIYGDNLPACDSACNVAVFFREEDGATDNADPSWEIQPLKVDIDGSTMTITGEASLFVKPELWELTRQESKNSTDDTRYRIIYDTGNFVSKVDIYCRSVNKQTPVTLRWDGVCGCPGNCDHETQTACAYVTDKRRGFFAPRASRWNGAKNVFTAPKWAASPESIEVDYRAGLPLTKRTCRMNSNMERAIVKLTNSLLPEPPCGFCDVAKIRWDNDRKTIDPLTPEAANMPWDIYTQGALEAWRIVKIFRRGKGAKLGKGYR